MTIKVENSLAYTLGNLSYTVGKKPILSSVNLDIKAGKITAILGPNGSGKSTLLKLLSGLLQPTSGSIMVDGRPLTSFKRKELARHLTMLPQHSPVPLGMTVKDLVSCGRNPYAKSFGRLTRADHESVDRALSRVRMDSYADSIVDHLSGGEMQRVWLAMVLAQETGILLLDEPTSWLDIAHQLRLLEIVKKLNHEKGITVIWILHDLNQALQYSDNIILLHQGSVLRYGQADSVLNQQAISEVFGVQTEKLRLETHRQSLFIPVSQTTKSVTEGVAEC